ncbi:MAG: hypothetical protein WBW38_07295 [Candidatus Sulfotelmatobacter sp.]
MKQVAILLALLLAVMINGCGNSKAVEAPSGSVWQAVMSGGTGTSSGFSFNTQFTVSSGGVLNPSAGTFEFLNVDTCYGNLPSNAITPAGTLTTTYNSADQVSGSLSLTITSPAGDVITLTSTSVTGTVNPNNNYVLSGTSIIGNWALVPGSGSTCVTTSGSFTMTQTGT